jgi:hypothetical protein
LLACVSAHRLPPEEHLLTFLLQTLHQSPQPSPKQRLSPW